NVVANVLAATQAAAQQQPTRSQPPPRTNSASLQTSNNVQSVQAQSDPVVVNAANNPTPSGTPIGNQTAPAFPLLPTDTGIPASVQPFFGQFNAILPPSLAAMPTVTLPTAGVGTYNGVAVGVVLNNGVASFAGGFNQAYNFGTLTGTANNTNFDGANYFAPPTRSGTIFTGTLTGPANRTGALAGTFFGPNAAVTGGGFAIQNPTNTYTASGAFAGK